MHYHISIINDKSDNSNDYDQSFKETQLVTYKFDIICKEIQRESISLFSV